MIVRASFTKDNASSSASECARISFLFLFVLSVFPLLSGCGQKPGATSPLLCYVGGTMRPAMEELARRFEKETGQEVRLDYADSGELLVKIETTHRGDLYVCHDPFLGALMTKGLGIKGWTVAVLTPTIAVPKGNPKHILSIKDLAQPGLRLGLTDEMYSTLGHMVPVIFEKTGLKKELERNITTRARMGGEVANAVAMGHLDAAIVWNAVIYARRDKLDAVPIAPKYLPSPGVDAVTTATFGRIDMSAIHVTIATLKCSRQAKAARKFAEFVASRRGKDVFLSLGFSPTPDDLKKIRLKVYCGAGLRPAMSAILDAFTKEYGVNVEADYAGSGVLLSRLTVAKSGDVYAPGDVSYLEEAEKKGLLAQKYEVCKLVPVILVRKGNPKGIKGITDLAKPGVRVGLGNPDACQIGRTAQAIFKKNGIDPQKIKKNVAFQSMTVNELGIQIKTGQLDAAIVWDAIAAYYKDSAEVVPIPPEQNVVSTVGIGVLKSSKVPDLAMRLAFFAAKSKESRAIWKDHDYSLLDR